LVRIKYKVDRAPVWGQFYASISGPTYEQPIFNNAFFAYFSTKISRRFADIIRRNGAAFDCHLSIDKKSLSCRYIPNNGFFWIRIRYMIAVINWSLWRNNITTMEQSCNCGDLCERWDSGPCLDCASRYYREDESSEKIDIASSFNRLMEETFGIS